MEGIATQLFRFPTAAGPDRVWAALTRPQHTALYGLAATSEWRPGAPLVFAREGTTLSGEVLAAEEPRRLSYSVRAGDGQPETYVTWEIVGDAAGSVVRLYVDEPGGAEADLEPESVWLGVVARLESVLAGTGAAERR